MEIDAGMTMLRRTGFQRPAYQPPPSPPLRRLERPVTVWRPMPVVTAPKSNPVRSEAYRRLVAALPCINCWIAGHSQCAHGPTLGGGIKCDDRMSFPLCAAHDGVVGCHALFDQYKLGDADWRREQADKWAAQTRQWIAASGTWPARLPMWDGA